MRRTIGIATGILLAVSWGTAGADTITIQPDDGKDAWILSSLEGSVTPHPNDPKLTTNSNSYINAGLLEFDLASLAGATIQSATLELRLTTPPDAGFVGIYQVTTPWLENTVTWNSKPGYLTTPADQYDFPGDITNVWLDFDLTDLVQVWADDPQANYGMLVGSVESDGTDYELTNPRAHIYSSDFQDGTDGLESDPRLTVAYTPIPIPGTVWLLGAGLLGLIGWKKRK
jgi:hypothetical protein